MRNLVFLFFLAFLISCKPKINQETRIKEDVTFLASDALEGRQTGTEGEKREAGQKLDHQPRPGKLSGA